ncbi:MAG: cation diffusion facilitator family transporter [Desulfurococcaceae archaeon]
MKAGGLHPASVFLAINALSAALKLVGLRGTNSVAAFVDAMNDLGDVVGLGMLAIGIEISRRGSSIEYPYGTRRAAYVVGLASLALFSSAVIFASALRLANALSDGAVSASSSSIAAFSAAFAANVATLVAVVILRRRRDDPALAGGFVDSLGDCVSGAAALASLVTRSNALDIAGGFAAALAVVISAATEGYRYFLVLIGRAPPKRSLRRAVEEVLKVRGVRDVNEVRAFMISEDEFSIALEVEVDGNARVLELEGVARAIEEAVRRADPRFKHVVVEFVAERSGPKTYGEVLREIEGLEE